MKKSLICIVVVSILLLGALTFIAGMSEEVSFHTIAIFFNKNLGHISHHVSLWIIGGPNGGAGPIPG